MKSYRIYAMTLFIIAMLMTFIIGCKYDVAEPPWYSSPPSSQYVTITGVTPIQATAGVNYITILGTNLAGALDSTSVTKYYYYIDSLNHKDSVLITNNNFVHNGVYVNGIQAAVVAVSANAIKILRPDITSDSCLIKIASDKSLALAKFFPYRITSIKQSFGDFTTNVPLSTITLDNNGNIYVIETIATPVTSNTSSYLYNLWKITPSGVKILLGYLGGGTPANQLTVALSLTDAKISPDGKLYYLQSGIKNSKDVHMIDLNVSPIYDSLFFKQITTRISYGDFAQNGYFYTGGIRSGIVIIRPDHSLRLDGYYTQDTINSIRVFNNYLYVATRTSMITTLWRHSLTDTSKIGSQELVLNCSNTILDSLQVTGLSFSADGSKMYIGTNTNNPIMILDLTNNNLDYLYKGILPTYCKQLCFGDNIYYISGNATPAVNWLVYKVDVGTTGAPYY